jgi:hypothetical protein
MVIRRYNIHKKPIKVKNIQTKGLKKMPAVLNLEDYKEKNINSEINTFSLVDMLFDKIATHTRDFGHELVTKYSYICHTNTI